MVSEENNVEIMTYMYEKKKLKLLCEHSVMVTNVSFLINSKKLQNHNYSNNSTCHNCSPV